MSENYPKGNLYAAWVRAIGTALPVVGIIIYLIGYLILLTYLRILNVPSVDFLKASCFETGTIFCVILLSASGIIVLPLLVFFLIKYKRPIVAMRTSILGSCFSVLATYLLVYSCCYVTLFLKPHEWPKIAHDFFLMVLIGVIGLAVIAFSDRIYNYLNNAKKSKTFLDMFYYCQEISRVLIFFILLVFSYNIYSSALKEHVLFFKDKANLYFLFYLILFLFIAYRFYFRFTLLFRNTSNSHQLASNKEESKKTPEKLGLSFNCVLLIVLFYLVVNAYVFGPFLYIPTSKGGGFQYTIANLTLDKNANIETLPFIDKKTKKSSEILLLAESSTDIYIVPYEGEDNPRKRFTSILKSTIYSIDKNLVNNLTFRNISPISMPMVQHQKQGQSSSKVKRQ